MTDAEMKFDEKQFVGDDMKKPFATKEKKQPLI
jgi:hypothetical protein